MSTHLVTGRAGKPHVSAEDIGAKDSGIFGAESYVLETGNQFACTIINNNLIRINDGDLIMQGRHVRVEGYEEVVIENGQLVVKRQDLIVMRYEMDADTGLETAYLAVIKGAPGNEPEDPEYEKGNILEGDIIAEFPLYRILLEGTNITAIDALFNVLMPMAKYQAQAAAMEKVIENQQKELTELNGKFEDYIKSETFSGTTDSTSNIHVSSNPNRIYIAAQPNIGQRILFPFRYLENRTYIRVLTNAGAAAPNTAISGTAWYIDLT